MPKDIAKLVKLKKIGFTVYIDATDITNKENINKLKTLGVERVNMGLDSGSFESLRELKNPNSTPKKNAHVCSSTEYPCPPS